MQPQNNNQFIDALEKRVEEHIQQAVKVYQNMNEAALLRPQPNGGWSIAQCLQHLNTYGHYYLPLLQQAINKSAGYNYKPFKSTWLGNYFTNMMEPARGKKKYRAIKQHLPGTVADAHQVVAIFIQQQETLLQYLQQARAANLNTPGIPISILKWIRLKPGDVLRFMVAHTGRHIQQANNNL